MAFNNELSTRQPFDKWLDAIVEGVISELYGTSGLYGTGGGRAEHDSGSAVSDQQVGDEMEGSAAGQVHRTHGAEETAKSYELENPAKYGSKKREILDAQLDFYKKAGKTKGLKQKIDELEKKLDRERRR